ncbi:MAG: HK97 family phage prohead protease [Rickettsiales bacterium]|nr:HK97 family phage prohead protease [Rickettsiales bacterium]
MEYYERKVSASVRERKRLQCNLSLKTITESGVFAGYGSVFNVVDSQRDMVLPGAFSDSLISGGSGVKLLWQHDAKEPIGIIEEIREDAQGLYVQGRLLLDVARAREAYSLLKEGVISGLSIGYSPVRYRLDPDSGVRLLAKVDLWEISLVTFPANDAARVTVVKQDDAAWQWAVQSGQAMQLADALDHVRRILMR